LFPGGSHVPWAMQAPRNPHPPFLHLVGQSPAQLALVSPQSQILSPHDAAKLPIVQTIVPMHVLAG
jgi:hypothetical protein